MESAFERVDQPVRQPAQPLPGESGEGGTLKIAVSLGADEFSELQDIAGRYALQNGLEMDLTNAEHSGLGQALLDLLTVSDSPDIVMMDVRDIRQLATGGFLLPIDMYQSTPGGTTLPALAPLLQWNGYDWGVPLDVDPYVLAYSPPVLESFGLDAPPSSLEEWELLLEGWGTEENRYLLSLGDAGPYALSALLASMDSALGEESEEVSGWMERAKSRFLPPETGEKNVWDRLASGTLAVAAVPLSKWRSYGNGTLAAVAPDQERSGVTAEALYGRSLALSAQSGNPEAAANFLSYLSTGEVQLEWLKATQRLPATNEPYRSPLPGEEKLPFGREWLLAGGADDQDREAVPSRDALIAAASALLAGGEEPVSGGEGERGGEETAEEFVSLE